MHSALLQTLLGVTRIIVRILPSQVIFDLKKTACTGNKLMIYTAFNKNKKTGQVLGGSVLEVHVS